MESNIKISIITVVRNNANNIQAAIESVLSQTYDNIEYIVVDGASTDGTVEIVRSYGNKISKFISEKDNGIYDAMNKGIAIATGDIIGFLHSDDLYVDYNIIKNVVIEFDEKAVDAVYGDLVYVQKDNPAKVLRYWKSGEFSKKKLIMGWMPPHPTFFGRREIYEKYGHFDTNFSIAADYDFMLRVLCLDITVHYIPSVLYKMRIGGASNKSLKNILKKSSEDLQAMKKNNIGNFRYVTLFMKNVSKIRQLFQKC